MAIDSTTRRYELVRPSSRVSTLEPPASEVEAPASEAIPTATPSLVLKRAAALATAASISRAWRWVPIATMMLFFIAIGFEPAEAQHTETTTADWILGGGLLAVLTLSYFAGSFVVSRGKRAGLVYTLPATLLFLGLVVSCPVSGHHAWGSWVIGSFGAGFAAAALHLGSVIATRGAARRA